MGDKDIIKALQICIDGEELCNDCPWYETDLCLVEIKRAALDLIIRQKAEIERLQKENSENFNKWLILDKRTQERYAELYEESKGVVRTEAIKEFAEKLKKCLKRRTEYDEGGWSVDLLTVTEEDIDNLVKEMTEGECDDRA